MDSIDVSIEQWADYLNHKCQQGRRCISEYTEIADTIARSINGVESLIEEFRYMSHLLDVYLEDSDIEDDIVTGDVMSILS